MQGPNSFLAREDKRMEFSNTESVVGHLHKGHSNEYMFNHKIMNSYL